MTGGEAAEGDDPTILLVEDNPDHAELVMRALAERHALARVVHVSDGEAALSYLLRRPPYADPSVNPRPQLVLVDLRLPRVDGFEVLQEMKNHPELRNIPAVILTTSGSEHDLARAYEQRANSYLVKPMEYEKFAELMTELGRYWLHCNRGSPS